MSNEQERDKETKRFLPTHGAYGSKQLIAITENKRQEIEQMIAGTRTMIAPSDSIAIELLARNLAKIQLFDEYLEEHGFFENPLKGEIQPLLKVYWQALNSAARLCAALGLTTESRLRLGLQTLQNEDALSRIQKAKQKKGKDESVC